MHDNNLKHMIITLQSNYYTTFQKEKNSNLNINSNEVEVKEYRCDKGRNVIIMWHRAAVSIFFGSFRELY